MMQINSRAPGALFQRVAHTVRTVWNLRNVSTVVIASAACMQAAAQDHAQSLPTIPLQAGFYNITAEVAQSDEERETGLMFRKSMPVTNGMLFVFERPGVQCFWMKNTLIPLSVAFIEDDGRIVNIDEMAPQTLNSHCSAKPVRFVLEMNKGWFAKRGIKAGSRIRGEPFAPR